MQLSVYGRQYSCARAVKGTNYVRIYDDSGALTVSFEGITDFSGYSTGGGGWSAPEPDLLAEADTRILELEYENLLLKGGLEP